MDNTLTDIDTCCRCGQVIYEFRLNNGLGRRMWCNDSSGLEIHDCGPHFVCTAETWSGRPCLTPFNATGPDHCPKCGAEYFEAPYRLTSGFDLTRDAAVVDLQLADVL